MKQILGLFVLVFTQFTISSIGLAGEKKKQQAVGSGNVNIVIHVSRANNNLYRTVFAYIEQLKKEYRKQKLQIEIVANGPGIGIVNIHNVFSDKITKLIEQGVKVTACGRTIRQLIAMNKPVPLAKGVKITHSGVVRVIELQRKGYLYLNP